MQVTILHRKRVKEKWYEKGVFKVALAIVSISVAAFTSGLGLSLMATLQAVATSIAISVAIDVAIGVLVDVAIKLGISPELVAVIAGAAMLTLGGYNAGKIDFAKAFNAKNLLKATNETFEGYQKGLHNELMNIKKEMEEFSTTSEEKLKTLEAAQDMLNTGVIPSNLNILNTSIIDSGYLYLGETAEEFYTRTINTDVTEVTTYIVENFYDITTGLPKPAVTTRYEAENVSDVLLIN